MTAYDRLKLAREDFDQQEKLYNTLVLGIRFYVGIVALLGGWSMSILRVDAIDAQWDTWFVLLSALAFWAVLLGALFHLFQLFRGDHWTLPRTLDHYLKWERERFKQIRSGEFDTGEKTPAEFAENEMLDQMMGAYADSACINRDANLSRQRRVTKVGKILLVAVIVLGVQGLARMIYAQRHGKQPEQRVAEAPAATAPSAGAGRYH